MVRGLLIRGMLAGLLAAVLAFGVARIIGEPEVDLAIAFEEQVAMAAGDAHDHEEEELVSRAIQASIGLFTGVGVYGVAFGGLFALAFAFLYGRIGRVGPRVAAALLAGAGFVAIVIVPSLKYPPNPPATGDPDTIGYRTALYFTMIAVGIVAMVVAELLRRRLVMRLGAWSGALLAAAAFVVMIVVAQQLLPSINEIPEAFPADVLWRFRIASLGVQLVLWATIGLGFGALAERLLGSQYRYAAPLLR